MDTTTLTLVFGWMTFLNLGYLIVATLCITLGRSWITGIHARMTGVPAENLAEHYFSFLANYKIAVIVLNLMPYLALRIVG
jgi:hypothetical protein